METTEKEKATAPAPATPVPTNGAVKAVEYWPERLVLSVREETLKGWREQLEQKVAAARVELAKLEGGIVQMDQEFARRERLADERKKVYARNG